MVAIAREPGTAALDRGIKCPDGSRRQPGAHVTIVQCSNSRLGDSLAAVAITGLGRFRRRDHARHRRIIAPTGGSLGGHLASELKPEVDVRVDPFAQAV